MWNLGIASLHPPDIARIWAHGGPQHVRGVSNGEMMSPAGLCNSTLSRRTRHLRSQSRPPVFRWPSSPSKPPQEQYVSPVDIASPFPMTDSDGNDQSCSLGMTDQDSRVSGVCKRRQSLLHYQNYRAEPCPKDSRPGKPRDHARPCSLGAGNLGHPTLHCQRSRARRQTAVQICLHSAWGYACHRG